MSHFGQCPECRREPVLIHVGKSHFATCPDCKVAWYVGYNLITTYVRMDDEDVRHLYGHADRDRITAEALATLETQYRRVGTP